MRLSVARGTAQPSVSHQQIRSTSPTDEEPAEFALIADALRAGAHAARSGIAVTERPAPSRVAPFGIAFGAAVPAQPATVDAEAPELGAGRLVVLHDPAGQPAWDGAYRVACYARAALDLEMVTDPVLPAVTWSWLEEALASRAAAAELLAGTVTTTAASRFGSLAREGDTFEVELRCSWSPRWTPDDAGSHLDAFVVLLGTMAGLPPDDDPSVVSLASRARTGGAG